LRQTAPAPIQIIEPQAVGLLVETEPGHWTVGPSPLALPAPQETPIGLDEYEGLFTVVKDKEKVRRP
jgi:hypothetical protein